jgi:hypothetical protein
MKEGVSRVKKNTNRANDFGQSSCRLGRRKR